jgi:hypothetical protein
MSAGSIVVVPHQPGPLIRPTNDDESRDDLDELVDAMFPDIDERPGWFDAGLAVVGAALVAWGWIGSASTLVVVLGVAALGLGCILPLRSAWRRARARRVRRRHHSLLQKGMLLDASSVETSSLIDAYEELLRVLPHTPTDVALNATAAAHAAMLEVASLLGGRAATSDRAVDYVEQRRRAIAAVSSTLRRSISATSSVTDSPADADAVIEARELLDGIAPLNAVTRLEAIIAEADTSGRDHA